MRPLETIPTNKQLASLRPLTQRLRERNYDEQALAELFRVSDLANIVLLELPAYAYYARQDTTSLGKLADLMLARGRYHQDEIEKLFGSEVTQTMLELGLLKPLRVRVGAGVDLYPCGGLFLFTEPGMIYRAYDWDHVYHLGADSYMLARLTPRRENSRSLDLCTGSGVHALLAAAHSETVVGADLNPRALAFSNLNARLNGISNCTFLRSDLWDDIPSQQYDLITANPPFIPTPDRSMQLYRTGGDSGEELSRRVVAELPNFLAPGGTLAMVVDYPQLRGNQYVDRLEQWLGETEGWGVAVIDLLVRPNRVYISQHIGFFGAVDPVALERDFCAYLEHYERHQIEQMRFGVVLIRRLAKREPNWKVTADLAMKPLFRNQLIQDWLDHLEWSRAPDWFKANSEWRPTLAEAARVYLDHRNQEGVLTCSTGWPGLVTMSAEQARQALQLDGSRPLSDFDPELVRLVGDRLALARTSLGHR